MNIDLLIANLSHPDFITRCDAARDLGKTKDPRAVPALLPYLSDPDWRIRRNAAQALGAAGHKEAVEPLLSALRDRVMTVRQRAVVALGRLKDDRALGPVLSAMLYDDGQVAEDAYAALRKYGKRAVPVLAAALAEAPTRRRMLVIELLALQKNAVAAQALVELTHSEEPHLRSEAFRLLSSHNEDVAVETLIDGLEDPDIFARSQAIRSLGYFHSPRILPALLGLLVDTELFGAHGETYRAVTAAVQHMAGLDKEFSGIVNHELLSMIGTLDDETRLDLNLMASQASVAYKELLAQFTLSASEPPDRTVHKNLEMIGKLIGAGNANNRRVDALIGLLETPDPILRMAAAISLPWHMDGRALPPLVAAHALEQDPQVHAALTWAVAALREHPED